MDGAVNVPKHLSGILNITENGETCMNGKIVCECGCNAFGIRYFGEQYPEFKPLTADTRLLSGQSAVTAAKNTSFLILQSTAMTG